MVDSVSRANQGSGKTANQGTEQLGRLIDQGRALAKAKKVQEAIAIFEQALALDPDNADTLASYAKAMQDVRQNQKAIELFEKSLKVDPKNIAAILSYNCELGLQAEAGNQKC
mgnify:CR=1 FL=1